MAPISKKMRAVMLLNQLNSSNSQSDTLDSLTESSSTSVKSSYSKVKSVLLDKNSEEYRLRREKNNIAVRKSRSKSKLKSLQALERMRELECENKKLHLKITSVSNELNLMKYLFVIHASEAHGKKISFKLLDNLYCIEAIQNVFKARQFTFNGV